jgi:hypothetical protein
MPTSLDLAVGVLFLLDVAVRPWSRARAGGNALYLALAYVPMLLLPHLGPWGVTGLVGGLALFSQWNYARMVGLTGELRFFVASMLGTAAFYVVARVHWYGLFQAMPAFAVCAVAAAGALRHEPQAFLQRLCLAWLGLLVYGYLGAHAALFPDLSTHPLALSGGLWVALVLFMAKCADLPWALARRLAPKRPWLQLVLSPLGGAAGGIVAALILPADHLQFTLLGGLIGAGLGFGSRAFALIATDVLGEAPDRPLKGTALFGVAFALALAYHDVRYLWT